MANNCHGLQNEENLVIALNNKKYKDLNSNLKRFVDYICKCEGFTVTVETEIKSKIETDNRKKQDLYITLFEKKLGVSVKVGSGNSTHQEKCEDFIDYIKTTYGASDQICDDIRRMLWCDGTIDGSGEISDRMTKATYLRKYKDEIKHIREFFKNNERDLINRILFAGRHDGKVDYIYHGTPEKGSWVAVSELIEYQVLNPLQLGGALARIGRMTVQVWNRSLNGNNDSKRGQIQIKYSHIEEDLKHLLCT